MIALICPTCGTRTYHNSGPERDRLLAENAALKARVHRVCECGALVVGPLDQPCDECESTDLVPFEYAFFVRGDKISDLESELDCAIEERNEAIAETDKLKARVAEMEEENVRILSKLVAAVDYGQKVQAQWSRAFDRVAELEAVVGPLETALDRIVQTHADSVYAENVPRLFAFDFVAAIAAAALTAAVEAKKGNANE